MSYHRVPPLSTVLRDSRYATASASVWSDPPRPRVVRQSQTPKLQSVGNYLGDSGDGLGSTLVVL